MNPTRRSFLGGAAAALGIASMPSMLLGKAHHSPLSQRPAGLHVCLELHINGEAAPRHLYYKLRDLDESDRDARGVLWLREQSAVFTAVPPGKVIRVTLSDGNGADLLDCLAGAGVTEMHSCGGDIVVTFGVSP